MKKRVSRFAPLLLLAASVGCGRSCGCFSGEKTYESIDGKVKVELVRKVAWSGGKIPGPITTFIVRVHTTPPIDQVVECDHVDLAEDDAGKNVAFRCQGTEPWNVLRLRGGDEHLYDCKAPVGTGKKPDFAKLDPVAKASDRILDCLITRTHDTPSSGAAVLVRAIAKDHGEEEAALFVARFASTREAPTVVNGDRWDAAYDALGEPGRARVRGDLCPAATDPKSASLRYVRAVRVCPLEGEAITAAANARFRDMLALAILPGVRTLDVHAYEWASALATDGDAACKAVTRFPAGDARLRHVLSVIARTKTRCAADAAAKIGLPCSRSIVCDGGLCDAERVRASLDADARAAREMDGGIRPKELPYEDSEAVQLAALYAQGSLPKDVVKRNARLTYAITPEDGPNCGNDEPTGSPCVCGSGVGINDIDICKLPLDGGAETKMSCVVRAIDAKKRIEVTRSCGGYLSGCEKLSCCPPYRCEDRRDAGFKQCSQP